MAKQGKIFLSKPWGGWVSSLGVVNSSTGASASVEGSENQYTYSIALALSREERSGHLAPGDVFTALADTNSYLVGLALPMNGSVASGGRAFVVLQNGYVVRINNEGANPIFTGYTIPVVHAANAVRTSGNVDCIIIKDAATTPNEYVVATWEDDGNTADAMVFIPTDSGPTTVQDSDWFSQGSSAN